MGIKELCKAMIGTKKFLFTQLKKEIGVDLDEESKNEKKNDATKSNELLSTINSDTSNIFKKNIHIYSHLDADGLCSAAILAQTFKREKIGFQISILRQLEKEMIVNISKNISKFNHFLIFSDFGSGQIDILKKYINPEDFLVIDHHKPENINVKPSKNHLNPYFYNIKGENEISGAGMCYLFSKTLNATNIDLSSIAIVGAIGDMQNSYSNNKFVGPNSEILKDSIESNKITIEKNIAISRSKSLPYALAFSLPIKLTGITGSFEEASNFLREKNISIKTDLGDPRKLIDLSESEKKTLTNSLVQYAIKNEGLSTTDIKKIITTFYLLNDFDPLLPIYDAKEMSSMLNACGRQGIHSYGIAALLGDQNALKKALESVSEYRKTISKGVNICKKQVKELSFIRTIYDSTIDERIIGTICSILVHSTLEKNKPLFGFANSDKNSIKVSARSDRNLIDKGLDLGTILREVCKELGIENPAGGHPPAAGAKIPYDSMGAFTDLVNKKVKEKLE